MWDIFTACIVLAFMDIFFPRREEHAQQNGELSDYALLGGMEGLRDDLDCKGLNDACSNDPYLSESDGMDW